MMEPTIFYASLLPAIFAYAEIHFRLGKFSGFLFKKEPEIIFDLPFRSEIGKNIPLFLFIKDADQYPVRMLEVSVQVDGERRSDKSALDEDLQLETHEKYFSRTFDLPSKLFPTAGVYEVTAELRYEVNGKIKHLTQDNYSLITHEPFEIYVSDSPLPSIRGWHWGDLHLHSNFTDDQVEFGAPIAETVHCARSLGLKFLAVTDHSFDLSDGTPSNTKWNSLIDEIESIQDTHKDFVLLSGEEVSAGNQAKQNVHCLLLGNELFYPGNGDGAKRIFKNRPTLPLQNLLMLVRQKEQDAITAAAHPADIPPLSQKLILNRGQWNAGDLFDENLDYWQILNGRLDKFFLQALEGWKMALLNKQRIGILAGTDAHGNFNCFRQIKTPLVKMVKHRQQLLGLTRSGVLIEGEMNRANLLKALGKKRVVISNGPIIIVEIEQNEQKFRIGDEFTTGHSFSINLEANSSPEFGALQKIYLYNGSYSDKKEYRIAVDVESGVFSMKKTINLSNLKRGYLRVEVYSATREQHYFCLTNPIWIY